VAIIETSNTPAVVTQTDGTISALSTASFTPDPWSLILVLWAGNSIDPTTPLQPGITDNLGTHLGWKLNDWSARADGPAADGQAATWWATVGGSPSAMTVTVSNIAASGGRHAALAVRVLSGAADQPIGAHGKSGSISTGSIAQTFTPQGDNSAVYLVDCDWAATGVQTAGAGTSVISSANVGAPDISYGIFKRIANDTTVPTTSSINATLGGTSTSVRWAYVEVRAQPTNVARPYAGPNPNPKAPGPRFWLTNPWGDRSVAAPAGGGDVTTTPAQADATADGLDAAAASTTTPAQADATGTAADASTAGTATPAEAAATGAAANPSITATVGATQADATATGQDAQGGVGPTPAEAAATATGLDATGVVSTATPAQADAAGTAANPAADIAVPANVAQATAAGQDAQGATGGQAGQGAATATGLDASATSTAIPAEAAATATGLDASTAITVNAGVASATADAFDATVSTSSNVNASAGTGDATGTAQDAQAAIGASAGTAAATGAGQDATGAVGGQAGAAGATATGQDATAANTATPVQADAVASAATAASAATTVADVAQATGAGLDAQPAGAAGAGTAGATAAGQNAAGTLTTNGGTADAIAAAFDAFAQVYAVGVAAAVADAFDAMVVTVSGNVRPRVDLRVPTGTALGRVAPIPRTLGAAPTRRQRVAPAAPPTSVVSDPIDQRVRQVTG
jgi:hypothetical protein